MNPHLEETFPDMFELMDTDVNDNEMLSQFLDATEKAIATTSTARTAETPAANLPLVLQNNAVGPPAQQELSPPNELLAK